MCFTSLNLHANPHALFPTRYGYKMAEYSRPTSHAVNLIQILHYKKCQKHVQLYVIVHNSLDASLPLFPF